MGEHILRLAPLIGHVGGVSSVVVKSHPCENPGTPKGSRTWNIVASSDMLANQGRVLIASRLRGEEVGNHFHPRVKNKDPERFFFLDGRIQFWFADAFGEKREETIMSDLRHGGPVMVELPPYILHGVRVLSEAAVFLELQEGPFEIAHNYTAEEFDLFKLWFAGRMIM